MGDFLATMKAELVALDAKAGALRELIGAYEAKTAAALPAPAPRPAAPLPAPIPPKKKRAPGVEEVMSRIERGMSRADVSAELGLTKGQVSGIVDRNQPSTARRAAAPRPTSASADADKVKAFIATKGVSHAADEFPSQDDVLAELRLHKLKVEPSGGKGSLLYKVNGQRKWQAEVLALANRFRQQRGLPVWDSRRVRWPRADGTIAPVPVQCST